MPAISFASPGFPGIAPEAMVGLLSRDRRHFQGVLPFRRHRSFPAAPSG